MHEFSALLFSLIGLPRHCFLHRHFYKNLSYLDDIISYFKNKINTHTQKIKIYVTEFISL